MGTEKILKKFEARFIDPISKGGMIFTDKKWLRGMVYISTNGVWTIAGDQKKLIRYSEISAVTIGAGNVDHYRGTVLAIDYLRNKDWHTAWLASSSGELENVKKLIFRIMLTNATVYFIAPAVKNNVALQDVRWKNGKIAMNDREIVLRGTDTSTVIPFERITAIEEDPDAAQPLLSVSYSHDDIQQSSWVVAPREIISMLKDYLQIAVRETYPESFDEHDNQVLSAIFMGLDDESIMKIAGIGEDELDRIYDKITLTGLAEVRRVKRVLDLTQKGVKYTTKIMKEQGQEIE